MNNCKVEDIISSLKIEEVDEKTEAIKPHWLCEDSFHDFITKVKTSNYKMGARLAKLIINSELITLHYGGKDSRGHIFYIVIQNDSNNYSAMSREMIDAKTVNSEKMLFEEMVRHYTNYFLGFLSN